MFLLNITFLNIKFNVFLKIWLIVFLYKKLFSFIKTNITSQKIIIIIHDKINLTDFLSMNSIA